MNDFMRLILFFDLPTITKKDRFIYSKFRNDLIKNGYMMMQFSVYSKIFPNRDSAVKHILKIKKVLPEKGSIRILMVTEKQYSKMEILVGGISKLEKEITVEPFLIL